MSRSPYSGPRMSKGPPTPEPEYPDDDPEDWGHEPCGSCEWCGTNIYLDDPGSEDELCEQCAWHADQAEERDPNDDDPGFQMIV